ncbi:MAG: aminotransferase class I/II-fold pyridoxal phosphate-dependent enzyme, partial [Candidatus Hydrogenedentales bacterium]
MLFNTLEMAPPDPILGLAEAFKKDPTPGKINLGIGVYKDAKGSTPVFQSVKRAEMRILSEEATKNYVNPNNGTVEYCAAVQTLLFGADNPIVKQRRAVSAHTPGGTGGLRLAADFIAVIAPKATVWLSDPTWPNHPSIFQAAGLAVKTYPYYDAKNKSIDFEAFLTALKAIPEGDFVLLHGCCHNPTGLDPAPEQWKAITEVAQA